MKGTINIFFIDRIKVISFSVCYYCSGRSSMLCAAVCFCGENDFFFVD